jgi:hypothetical protein
MKTLFSAAVIAVTLAAVPQTGLAHGGVVLGFSFGVPVYAYPPPVYYAPPPPMVVYALPPPQPLEAVPTSPVYSDQWGRSCREYQSTAVIGGLAQSVHGTACLQSDGTWQVVR